MIDIQSAPRDGTWVWLYGPHYEEPRGHLGFWDEESKDWYDSEAASHSLTGSWQPTHWFPFVEVEEHD